MGELHKEAVGEWTLAGLIGLYLKSVPWGQDWRGGPNEGAGGQGKVRQVVQNKACLACTHRAGVRASGLEKLET